MTTNTLTRGGAQGQTEEYSAYTVQKAKVAHHYCMLEMLIFL